MNELARMLQHPLLFKNCRNQLLLQVNDEQNAMLSPERFSGTFGQRRLRSFCFGIRALTRLGWRRRMDEWRYRHPVAHGFVSYFLAGWEGRISTWLIIARGCEVKT